MPQPTAPRSSTAAGRATRETEVAASAKAPDLTVNKVLAGAGAAVTSALLGSYFGATGTVAGAALGSVASTVATTLYQRSLDRTRDTILARVRVTAGRRTDLSDQPTVRLEVPAQRGPVEQETTVLRTEPVLRRPNRFWMWAGATVLVFVVGLLVVTGLEWAKGSSLTTGTPGTSVGRVLTPGADGPGAPAAVEPTTEPEPTSERPAPSAERTAEPEPSAEAPPSPLPGPVDVPRPGAEPTQDPTSAPATPEPTPNLLPLPGEDG